jgi:mannose-1-phosphate guanylyltransferase
MSETGEEKMDREDSGPETFAVLLAGGAGTRLWPVSRELFPKQLVSFFGNKSLIQHTVERLSPVIPSEQIRVVCGSEHYFEIERHMSEIGVPPEDRILAEPCGRNTAPAILLAVTHILQNSKDAVLCIFPADHVIKNVPGFHDKLKTAVRLAEQGFVVTFGIQADYPETGYGYIEGGEPGAEGAFRIRRFVEKPDLNTARQYIDAGNYFWNSGMFAFKASVMRSEFEAYHPELLEKVEKLINGPEGITLEGYAELEDISIDYAIMEKTDKGVVLPSDFGWSDIGSWKSLYDYLPKDENGNVMNGDVVAENTRNCFVMGYHRLIATNALENLVVVDTPDSVFVSNIETSRDVKSIVNQLKKTGRGEYHHHRTVYQQWGTETLLADSEQYTVYKRVLYPMASCNISGKIEDVSHFAVVAGAVQISIDGRSKSLTSSEAMTVASAEEVAIENVGHTEAQIIQTVVRR